MNNQDWTPEEDEAFNEVEKNSTLGKQILRDMGQPYVYAPKREWVGLSNEEMIELSEMQLGSWDLILEVEAKLKEKNT